MRTKILIATEKEPSFTARLTPNQIGELLAKCNKSQFNEVMESLLSQVKKYGTDDQQENLLDSLVIASGDFLKYWEGKTILNNKGGKDD